MIDRKSDVAGAGPENSDAAALGAADWLCLAAMPTFATMALLAGVSGDPPDTLCMPSHAASALSGMPVMYLMMSAFHAAPWLRLAARRRRGPADRAPWSRADQMISK